MDIQNISYAFGVHEVIKDVSFHLSHGQFVSIVGKSGCGKTTLLNLISRLLRPNIGEISNYPAKNIAYLTQKPTLLSFRNAFENAILGLELRGETIDKEYVRNLFYMFGIEDAMKKYPHELSGGMKQRVGIIQTIALDSCMYLFDEPFTAIDRNTQFVIEYHMWNLLKEKKASVIFISHDLEQSLLFSDRIIMLSSNPGTIVYDQLFAEDFVCLSPKDRKSHPLYTDYFIEIIKHFSEL